MEQEKKTIPLSELTEQGACKHARSFKKTSMQVKNDSIGYWRTVIDRCAIIAALKYKKRNPKDIMQYMMTRYTECGFQNYQQKQAQLFFDHWRIMRYLKSENRKISFMKKKVVDVSGIPVEARPDAAVITDDKTIELIIYKVGKPTMKNKSKKRQMQKDLQLYALIMYAREQGYTDITASFYFMRKDTDMSSVNRCSQFFFGNGGNVVQIHDEYEGVENETDQKVAKLISMYKEGIDEEDLCPGTCDFCKYYDICKYALPPAEIKEEETEGAENGEQKKPEKAKVVYSEEQKEAIAFNKGVCRIIAGAGSGKTETVTERVAQLLRSGVKPEEIFMTTFTKNGANEMLARIEKKAGRSLPGLTVSTFNAFENEILKENYEMLGYKKPPTLIDSVMLSPIISDILDKNPIYEWSGKSFVNYTGNGFGGRGALKIAEAVFSEVKKARSHKNDELLAARAAVTYDEINERALRKLVKLYDKFDQKMKEAGLISFEDQELATFKVLEQVPDYLEKRYSFKHVIIDEFQDSSESQIDLIRKLREMPCNESVMVVGDDAQSIYGFRDTTPEYIINFEKYIGEDVTDICLDKNFRSTPQICDFATKIMEYNQNKVDKDLVPARGDGMPVVVNGFKKVDEEYAFIVENIKALIDRGTVPENIAVSARTKRELRKIADLLTKAGIPSMFGAPEPLMDNSRIKAFMSFVRMVIGKGDEMDAAKCANALMGGGLIDLSAEDIDARKEEVIERANAIAGAFEEERKAKLFEFMDDISFGDEVIEEFKEQLDPKTYDEIVDYVRDFGLYGEGVEYRRTRKYPGVLLITCHSSKGLEWPIMFVTVNKFPMGPTAMEETRRLFFVSATRARDELYVSGVFNLGSKEHVRYNRILQEAYDIKGYSFPVL